MDLSIIIVSYKTKDVLKNCLLSIKDNVSKKITYEIIVSDNGSNDKTTQMISDLRFKTSDLTLIENRENLGFSKANNVGVKESKGRYILFLNPDTVIQKDTLEKMVEFMDKTKDAGAATCKVLLPSGNIDDSCHRGFPTPWNSFCHFSGLAKVFPKTKIFGGYNLSFLDMTKTHEIDALAGSFMIVKREAGEDIGWWDEDYFFYGEDLDFCYMLKQKGWKVYYVPDVSILHLKGVSGGIKKISKEISTADKETKRTATKWRFDAMRIFYKKHYENKYPWIVTKLVYFGISLKQLSASL